MNEMIQQPIVNLTLWGVQDILHRFQATGTDKHV
jgi:hypothetical protein